jgi:secernin
MASDMVVALAGAALHGQTLFGHNSNRPTGEAQEVVRIPGRAFAPGEAVRATAVQVPQVRQTATVLAGRPVGAWGYQHGVNHHGVAVGLTTFRTRLASDSPGLSGPELVRLTLERSATALQAVDLLTDLICRHGLHPEPADGDARAYAGVALMLVDAREAFVLAACGRHWALQAVGGVRALGEVCRICKDWDRISRGLADLATQRGWWECDGSKLDFADAVGLLGPSTPAALRRWGQCTVSLETHYGQVDGPFLRRLLAEHGLNRPEAEGPETAATSASLIVQAGGPQTPPQLWHAFGSPCTGVYFPLSFDADPPAAFRDGELWRRARRLLTYAALGSRQRDEAREALVALQARIDAAAVEFHAEADPARARGDAAELHRLAESYQQQNLERWEEVYADLFEEAPQAHPAVDEQVPMFVG